MKYYEDSFDDISKRKEEKFSYTRIFENILILLGNYTLSGVMATHADMYEVILLKHDKISSSMVSCQKFFSGCVSITLRKILP